MGEHQLKARRERAIAEEIAHELTRSLGLAAMPPEASTENQTVVCETFTRIFDRYQIANESSARRILGHVSKALARLNFEFAELDAAMRQGKTP